MNLEHVQVTIVDAVSYKGLEAAINQVLYGRNPDKVDGVQYLGRDGGRLLAMVSIREALNIPSASDDS